MTLPNVSEINKTELPKVPDYRGNLTFLYSEDHLPFKIHQAYWIYDIRSGSKSEGYSLTGQNEFIISLSGSFVLKVFDGINTKEILLNQPDIGVCLPAGIWREINKVSEPAVVLVLSDGEYNKSDRIFDINQFKSYRNVLDNDNT